MQAMIITWWQVLVLLIQLFGPMSRVWQYCIIPILKVRQKRPLPDGPDDYYDKYFSMNQAKSIKIV